MVIDNSLQVQAMKLKQAALQILRAGGSPVAAMRLEQQARALLQQAVGLPSAPQQALPQAPGTPDNPAAQAAKATLAKQQATARTALQRQRTADAARVNYAFPQSSRGATPGLGKGPAGLVTPTSGRPERPGGVYSVMRAREAIERGLPERPPGGVDPIDQRPLGDRNKVLPKPRKKRLVGKPTYGTLTAAKKGVTVKPKSGMHKMPDGHMMSDAEMKKKMGKKPPMMKNGGKVEKVMHEYKAGTLRSGSPKGPKVTSRKQAIAIGLSEQRKAKRGK